MIACLIRYKIDPFAGDDFNRYAEVWGEAIPRAGADLIGYFGPYEGSATTAFGIYMIRDLAEYEAYRARLKADAAGQANFAFAREKRFIRAEERIFLKPLCGPFDR